MASFFKNLFRKDEDSQPIPAAPLTNDLPAHGRPPIFQEAGPPAPPLGQGVRNSLQGGPTGPFSAVSGRHMTAREIAALLPAALLRFDGISPDQPVPLPLGPLRESMQAGRPVLRLSQIQLACPELFQRPPLPEEDIEITLPLARVKGILESSAPMIPASAVGADTGPQVPASSPTPLGNPFASRMAPSPFTAASPFAAGSASIPPRVPSGSSPFATSPAAGLPLPPSMPQAVASPLAPPSVAGPALSPSPFAATPTSGGSPFAVIKSATAPSLPGAPSASPFAVAKSVENSEAPAPAPTLFPPPPPAPSPAAVSATTPFSPVLAVAQSPASQLPANPGVGLSPSPFARDAAKSVPPPLAATFNHTPASSAPAPLSWPPAASSSAPPLPIAPQPRTAPIPSARSSPISATAPVMPPAPSPQKTLTTPIPLAMPQPVMAKASLSAPVSQISATPAAASALVTRTAPIPSTAATGAMIELSLRAVLRDADPAELGFVPDNVPESVRVTLPVELVSRQLANGRVTVSLEAICVGISEKFRPAFARAREGLLVTIPMSEVFHNLPESARPALEPVAPAGDHLSITTSPFQTPFAIRAEEDTSRHLLDLTVTGFNPSNLPVRPSTHPVPPAALPHAPFPPVLPAYGGPPAVQVDLPILRPVANTAVEAMALPPLTSRPGLLSRPPGSGTAPTEPPAAFPITPAIPAAPAPKSPPRLRSAPASPTALRAFPKPSAPPPAGHENGIVGPSPSVPSEFPLLRPPASLPAAESLPALPLPPPDPVPLAPLSTSWALPAVPDVSDDLGESFSAAKLSAEPPPRAGSVPVSLLPLASTPVPSGGMTDAPSQPVNSGPPSWPSGSLATPVPVADLAPSSSAWLSTAGASFHEPNPAPASLAPVAAAQTAAVHLAAPVAPSPATSPLEDLTFGCITDLRQLTLRAVLGTDQVLTGQDIVDRCAALPGLKACVLLQSNATLTSHGMDDANASAFRSSAAKTRESLATLAETMGLGTGGNFTLRTDHGIRSFFLEANLCLAVWHAQPQFSGGTREKLILITQELSKSEALPVS